MQGHKVGARAPAQAQGVKAEVTGAALLLVLNGREVAVLLRALQVVLGQRLVTQQNQEHRGLHLVQAEGAVQLVLDLHGAELVEHGAPVSGLAEDGQERTHREAAMLHLGLTVVVVDGLGRLVRLVEGARRDGDVQGVEAQVGRGEPRVLEVLVGRDLGRRRVATEEAARSAGLAAALARSNRTAHQHGHGRRQQGTGASLRGRGRRGRATQERRRRRRSRAEHRGDEGQRHRGKAWGKWRWSRECASGELLAAA
mmetsp:Transcript_44597/g.117846  ORF Transcript_44597/g.117846 Transcript_44597/m.117846 type:complete len:255 (-) Transcript_44597:24-788(-)